MQHSTYFKTFLKEIVDLDQTRLDKLKNRVDAVDRALNADTTVGPIITGLSRQGSWAHRTIIRPRTGGEFDADFFVHMDEQDGWDPAQYINEVYHALGRHPRYEKQERGRKCRCVFLKYAPERNIGCHLDIVPLITLAKGSQVIVNRDNNVWEPAWGSTDPQGFTDWVKRRDELSSRQFRRVTRLMKYLKRERGSFNGVNSVILTTLLGQQVTELNGLDPSQYRNTPTALLNIVEDLDRWLQARPSKPSIANPSGDGTNFDHRWEENTYRNFRDRIHTIASKMRAAYEEQDKDKSITKWQALVGDKFEPPASGSTASAANPLAGLYVGETASRRFKGRAG